MGVGGVRSRSWGAVGVRLRCEILMAIGMATSGAMSQLRSRAVPPTPFGAAVPGLGERRERGHVRSHYDGRTGHRGRQSRIRCA